MWLPRVAEIPACSEFVTINSLDLTSARKLVDCADSLGAGRVPQKTKISIRKQLEASDYV